MLRDRIQCECDWLNEACCKKCLECSFRVKSIYSFQKYSAPCFSDLTPVLMLRFDVSGDADLTPED